MRRPLTLLLAAVVTVPLVAQDPEMATKDTIVGGPPPTSPDGLPEGMTTETMWRPPTAEDWAKPVLMEFERSWADAVAVARETNKPIMVCINMDGEPASEHYAGVHYRTPETAEYFEDFVCVIASVYRHTPKDYDENGQRILCPRFGCVTCSEHIWIEPFLYERFMNGTRISPRHIMVELDGNEVFDVYHAWDNQSVFDTIEKGIAERQEMARSIARGDRPVLERVASRARVDREAVEKAYREADRGMKEQLLRKAIESPEGAPVGLLRLAIFGFDEGLAKLAREALAKVDSPSAVDLLGEALRVPLDDAERESLVGALERQREKSPWARILTNVHRGLASAGQTVDVEGWSSGGQAYRPATSVALEERIAKDEAALRSAPKSPEVLTDLAESSLVLAIDPSTADRYWGKGQSQYGELLIEDARRRIAAAREVGGSGWRLDALDALTHYYGGDKTGSFELAVRAAEAMPPAADSMVAVSTLALFAEARIDAIWKALRAKEDWPSEWMTDVSSAYAVLARHPLGNDSHAVLHYDFLHTLRAHRRAGDVLDQAIARYPGSSELHRRVRARVLRDRGADGLGARYRELIEANPDEAALYWFGGYAAMVEAEYDRREKNADKAVVAYDRAIELFEGSIERSPGFAATADHYVALSLAAKARLAIEAGDLDAALELLLAGIARHPEATPAVDGMELSPYQTARLLRSRLEEAGQTAELERLQATLDGLDPSLLRMPAYETPGARSGRRGRGRGR